MTQKAIKEFINTWSQVQVNEIGAAQSHFNDVCALVGHDTPIKADPQGIFFRFEQPAEKVGGAKGRADVWYDKKFIWEYKGAHANLDKAYQQLLLYRESLGNPPLLITSDLRRIIIHSNFTNTVKQAYVITFERLAEGDGLNLLQSVFYNPNSFQPTQTQTQVTQASADTFVQVAETLQKWASAEDRQEDLERLAHFIIRLLFALFAEDMGLLPENIFTELIKHQKGDIATFSRALKGLFAVMRDGGMFGYQHIPHFDGGLFDDDYVPDLPGDILHTLMLACDQNWAGIDPSILGTLFERIIDESKRAQLGAHYTSKEDIMLIVEPVLMKPLRDEWQQTKAQMARLISIPNTEKDGSTTDEAYQLLSTFSEKISATRVLDPACGSGNFLYVALRQLLDLQKEVIAFCGRHGLPDIPLTVGPEQLYGIEINPYAHELAQVTVWIGYLQWRFENGFSEIREPILRTLQNIERKDAILFSDANGEPIEPEWPEVDIVIGNPPFLGSRLMRPQLGDKYCDALHVAYAKKMKGLPDLVCYWFDRAQSQIARGKLNRAGLLATQAIRGGTNRQVLDRIKEKGNIFLAWSDREWILDGAMVHVSIVGFDDGSEKEICLNGHPVPKINSDLTSVVDLSIAERLSENSGISFQGVVLRGPFNIPYDLAQEMITTENPNSLNNSDVIRPRRTGQDVVGRSSNSYVIDFGIDTPIDHAEKYKIPFEYIKENVYPMRQEAKQAVAREKWWIHWNPRTQMREALGKLYRYIATPRVSKYRIFVWLDVSILPDAQLVVFARSDDYFFGVLHSTLHEIWARRMGTQLRDAESGFRYTSTTTFETFPLPWPPGEEPGEAENENVALIAELARKLVAFRQNWLKPPEEDIGVIISEKMLKRRTLTNLYNTLAYYRERVKGVQHNPITWRSNVKSIIDLDEIETLDYAHSELDRAVLDAYGLTEKANDEQILEHLLALNNSRA